MGTRIVSGIHSVPVTVLGPLLPLLFSFVFTANTPSPGQVVCPVRIVTVEMGLPGSKAITLHYFWACKAKRFLEMSVCFIGFSETPRFEFQGFDI